MVGAKMLRDCAGELRFRVVGLAKNDRERAGTHTASAEDADQAAGIDATGKKHSHRHIADQLHAHGFVEHLRDLGLELSAIFWAGIGSAMVALIETVIDEIVIDGIAIDQIPIALHLRLSLLPGQITAGRKRTHSIDQSVWIVNGSESEIVHQARGIYRAWHEAGSQQGADLGRQNKVSVRPVVIERLDTHGIAGGEKAMAPRVPNGEGKHAAKFREAFLTPLSIGFEDHFRVGMTAEVDSLALQFRANLAEVVNLAVVDDPIAGGRIIHGLMAKRRQIENCETAIPESYFDVFPGGIAQNDCAAVVRSAVGEGFGGAFQHGGGHTRIMANDADNSAHPDVAPSGFETHLTRSSRRFCLQEPG